MKRSLTFSASLGPDVGSAIPAEVGRSKAPRLEHVPDDPALTAAQAAVEVGLSLAAFWRAVAAKRFPNPVYPLPRAPRWFRSELREAMLGKRMKPSEALEARCRARREAA